MGASRAQRYGEMTDGHDAASEEKALVKRAQSGDALAFESLYRANVGRVYAVCLRMLKNPSSAEDLTQEAFVRAWTKLHTYRGASAFSTWMHRLTVNLVLSELRAQGRKKERLMTADALT
ncbi:MAG: sigma-70 family RNA polymerase sigma factor, partial [Candidatus Hydrogenedentes bacterium]|nr:sigma-70 family RNA polymerase sigma factor [Candidatus Hydrogenedentota bacterium]